MSLDLNLAAVGLHAYFLSVLDSDFPRIGCGDIGRLFGKQNVDSL